MKTKPRRGSNRMGIIATVLVLAFLCLLVATDKEGPEA